MLAALAMPSFSTVVCVVSVLGTVQVAGIQTSVPTPIGNAADAPGSEPHPKAEAFAAYLHKKGASYAPDTAEYRERFALFVQRDEMVETVNSRPGGTWQAALNAFADRTEGELKRMLGYKRSNRRMPSPAELRRVPKHLARVHEEPGGVNWVTSLPSLELIRDQGMCGSCWAVSATTVLDAHAERFGGNRSFSSQHVVDCVPNPSNCGGSGGCDGATIELAFQYAMLKGIDTPETYGSYTGMDGACSWTADEVSSPTLLALTGFSSGDLDQEAPADAVGRSYGMTGWSRLPSNSYAELIYEITNTGPVGIALAANSLFLYASGIFDGCDWTVNHAVALVGYGTDGGLNYWLVQNSWGYSWGEEGRIRIARLSPADEDRNCGMDDQPEMGIACEGETDPVEVCGTCGVLYDSVVPRFQQITS